MWHFPKFWGPLSSSPAEGPGLGPSSRLRRGDWKLIYYHADQRFELFNLARDLGEEHNFAAQRPKRVREMAIELTQVLQQCAAPMPVVKASGRSVSRPIEAWQP